MTASSELRFEGGATSAVLTLRRSAAARVMRLRVDQRTGAVVLTVPRRASAKKALAWAAEQRQWIEGELAAIAPPARLGPGSQLPLYGEPHIVEWVPGASRAVRREDGRLLVGGPQENLEARLLRWLRRHAVEVLAAETREFAAKAGVSVGRIGVGDPLSRW